MPLLYIAPPPFVDVFLYTWAYFFFVPFNIAVPALFRIPAPLLSVSLSVKFTFERLIFPPLFINAPLKPFISKLLPTSCCFETLIFSVPSRTNPSNSLGVEIVEYESPFIVNFLDCSLPEVMESVPAFVYQDEKMDSVMDKFERTQAWNLPVLDDENKYLGFVSKSKIFSSYREQLREVSNE